MPSQDQPPQNRAQRRAAQRGKGTGRAALVRPFRQPQSQSQSQNAAPGPHTATGGPYSADSAEPDAADAEYDDGLGSSTAGFPLRMDRAPTDRKVSHHKGGSKQARMWNALVSYYAFGGMIAARWDRPAGELVMAKATDCADAWMAAGRANPQIMRVLEIITVAGPYTALVMVHADVAMGIMAQHGVTPMTLFVGAPGAAPGGAQGGVPAPQAATDTRASEGPPPLPYQPVGPHAPTEAPPAPPIAAADDLLIIPDEGLPAEIDVALRQAARQSGRPYAELRQEALVQLAQLRMAQNGHQRVQQPGALGAPIAEG